MNNILAGIVGLVAFVIVLVIIGPFLAIWAWNTLFTSYPIDYTFSTWAAVVILGAFIRANVSIKK
jgi:hypothetical protein